MTATEDGASGGKVVSDLVVEMLAAEDKRRESLEARGRSVITVSGTLVTLLLALAAVGSKGKNFHVPQIAQVGLGLAVVAFIVAALLAIATYVPQPARVTDPAELMDLLPRMWNRGSEFWLQKSTVTRLDQLATTQAVNDKKARLLLGAISVQVLAVLLLAWAVLETL